MNNFDALAEFEKEFKRLFRKYKTLDDDFEKFKAVLRATPIGVGKNFNIIHSSEEIKIIKAHLACRYLRNNHLIRIIYAYFEQEQRIEFIELYFKGEQANEDNGRINDFLRWFKERKVK